MPLRVALSRMCADASSELSIAMVSVQCGASASANPP